MFLDSDILNHKIFKILRDIISEEKCKTYLIGGYVRDFFLKKESKDIDIVVVGNGIAVAEKLAEKINGKVSVFKRFGTAMVKYNDLEIEFVGARKESYNEKSRNPKVSTGSFNDDINRRDFTINAMAVSLNEENFGELIDKFNGIKDLENKIIKTPLDPSITFSDDPLRILRAVRFASQLNFKFDEETFKAIYENRERIKIISQERITDEINKIIASPKPSVGFKLLFNSGVLEIIFSELADMQGVDIVEGKGHKDNFYHTIQVLDNIAKKTENLWLRWAAILHDIGKPATKKLSETGWTFHGHEFVGSKMVVELFKRMRLPMNEKMRYVQKLVRLHLRPIALVEEEVTDSAVRRLLFDAGDDIDDLMLLCEADITSKKEEKVKRFLNNFKQVRKKIVEVEEKDKIRNWQPPITGEMIIKAFGISPSKNVGIIKNAIKDAILDGVIPNTKENAIDFMKQKGEELGLKFIADNI